MSAATAGPAGATAGGVPAVAIRGLRVAYGSAVVLDDLELTVPAGTALCVTGANGAGKSTLLRCATGLQAADAGTIRVFGRPPGRSAAFWRDVATTVENPGWYSGLTVREHAELIRLAHGADPADGALDKLFDLLGLVPLADAAPLTLSSGQRQRFLLAAVLARPSRLLVLDEPEQRLDTDIKPVVAELLRTYVAGGGALLMASHDPEFAAEVGGERLTL
ncbi:ATP-binding cassette domain-containing protein [Plantactinospora siamensis]|uniref:ATP-binding cassette domain-containing protein n=1 Tax=Plantactinospora siamensis TaxID=555372 RepID=A0ABV6NSJ6_9ACTN